MALSPSRLRDYPHLTEDNYRKTSDETDQSNCIAWVVGDQTRRWWPHQDYYWPPGVPYEETVDAFVALFRQQGYEVCENADLEAAYEKVAIYVAEDGLPAHAAIQLASGLWSSKLGEWEDIEHAELGALDCPNYGTARVILKRPRTPPG